MRNDSLPPSDDRQPLRLCLPLPGEPRVEFELVDPNEGAHIRVRQRIIGIREGAINRATRDLQPCGGVLHGQEYRTIDFATFTRICAVTNDVRRLRDDLSRQCAVLRDLLGVPEETAGGH